MVKAFEGMQNSRSFNLKKMFDMHGRLNHSAVFENENDDEGAEESNVMKRNLPLELQRLGSKLDRFSNKASAAALTREDVGTALVQFKGRQPTDNDLMKERFAKLLLGEDMSGGGKGVSSALALSNAITNLSASVFGEHHKLEPLSAATKARWRKEIDWLLSVTDHIVEFVPSQQKNKDGSITEIMVTRQRNDLRMNIPALRKLDAMLLEYLDNFKDQNEFWYPSKDENDERTDDKWWIPKPKVPPEGLSEMTRRWILFQKESVNQVLKAAMAINAQVLSEMEIPENYIESLPKNGRSSLGESIYKSITVEYFDPQQFLSTLDLSTEHKVLDVKNRIEASIVIWTRKMNNKDTKSSWGSAVSLEKRELFEERAETILLLLKQRFPGLPQSALDISKIQYNRDVGHAVLESYSRILESVAFAVISRIEDVIHADSLTQSPLAGETHSRRSVDVSPLGGLAKFQCPGEEIEITSAETPNSMTLSDFMGWQMDQSEPEVKKSSSQGHLDENFKLDNDKIMSKIANIVTSGRKLTYIDNLSGQRSPTARQ
ncbi:PRONE domain [Dillenia turbinata]|uniref:PRONE domain n=1 Tax=Dillenia turbinata TaxID=194707 RepID=A0AAN8ZP51_9MAGN